MSFLQAAWLVGLLGMSLPIALHLHRRRTRTVDWAAMRFLQQSLTNRRQGLTLEQLLLLACRCLVMAAFVVAMARPWAADHKALSGVSALILAGAGIVGLAWSTVWMTSVRRRVAIGAACLALLALAGLLTMGRGDQLLAGFDEPRDVVLIVDGSDSMNVPRREEPAITSNRDQVPTDSGAPTHFLQARIEAERFLQKLPNKSTAALLVVGPMAKPQGTRLHSQLHLVREQLRGIRPPGGHCDLAHAIDQARSILQRGQHARQQIVVFTDNQMTNWQFVQDDNGPSDEQPGVEDSDVGARDQVWARVFPLPASTFNLAITKLEIDETAVRPGQKVKLRLEVFNGGTETIDGASIEILVNSRLVQSISAGRLEPGLRQMLPCEVEFDQPGVQLVSARFQGDDDIAADNRLDRAVAVQPPIRALVVNGESTRNPNQRPATYVQLALGGPAIQNAESGRAIEPRMVIADAVEAAQLSEIDQLHQYQTLILCDVPRLRSDAAQAIGEFVRQGGGLIILLGSRCEADFYNQWKTNGQPLLPISLNTWSTPPGSDQAAIEFDVTSMRHDVLDAWIESGEHDLLDWTTSRHWQVEPLPNQLSNVVARWSNGAPLLIERTIERGRVLIQTTAPDPQVNSLISRVSFPVWMHLLTRCAAETNPIQLHQEPNSHWTLELPGPAMVSIDIPPPNQVANLTLKTPSGIERPVTATFSGRQWLVELGTADESGQYELSGELASVIGPGPWPLTVGRSDAEADLTAIEPQRLHSLAQQFGISLIADEEHFTHVAAGFPDGLELWRYFAYTALLLLGAESILLWWVRTRRTTRLHHGTSACASSVTWLTRWGSIPLIWCLAWLFWTRGWQAAAQSMETRYDPQSLGLGALAATISCVVIWTYWDRQGAAGPSWPSLMKTMRLILVGLLGFVLLEPMHHGEEETVEQRQVIVLWDRSESMSLPVAGSLGQPHRRPQADDRESEENSRAEVVQQLLWDGYNGNPPLMRELERDYGVQLYEFAASARRLDRDRSVGSVGSDKSDAWSQKTDLSAALQRSLADVSLNELSGVIIVTDGCDRSSVPFGPMAAMLGRHSIPIHSVIIGNQTPIKDAEVSLLQAPGQVFAGDQVTVGATIKADQLRGETATIRFLRDGEVLQTQTLRLPNDQVRTSVQFTDEPEQVGLYEYAVEIEPLANERITENNRRAAGVSVTKDRVRLLIVEQRPRWEFRYLKNLFAGRDRNVALQYVLLSPDRLAGVPEPPYVTASTARAFDDCEATAVPATEREWLKFDVIILGDVDPRELNVETQRTLYKFVRQRGGTLIVMTGQHAMPNRYWDSPLAELFPVQRPIQGGADAIVNRPGEITLFSTAPYRLRLTEDGLRSQILHSPFADADDSSIWSSLPILYGRQSAAVAKPGATVLAWADVPVDPPRLTRPGTDVEADRAISRQNALILWHRFGGGRVLQLNFDQTWRLRFWNGDEHHHRFWGRVMRWAADERLGMGTDLVRLGTDRNHYAIGDTVSVKVRLVTDSEEPALNEQTHLMLFRDGTAIHQAVMQEVPDSGGLLQANLPFPDLPGRYRIQVGGTIVEELLVSEGRAGQSVFAEFSVDGTIATNETLDIVARSDFVIPLAEQTGGSVLVPETANEVLERLGPKSNYERREWSIPLWNTWPVVVLFMLLISGEWIARRCCGLI